MTRNDRAMLVALIWLSGLACARGSEYERREISIPMRDGVRLHAIALRPRGDTTPLPILLVRTPFGAAAEFSSADVPAPFRELAQDGYIFVAEDIRGRNGSG